MEEVKRQSRFSRFRANEGKMGAYYTDPAHCRWIHNFLEFPKESEVCCLDPSIGNAKALRLVTGKDGNKEHVKLFGVEINKETCEELRQEEGTLEGLLEADFIDGVYISHNSFSFCFMNPPYGTQDKERLEIAFLGKVIPYLTKKAVLVFVLPGYVFKSPQFLRRWCSNFETLHYYRFHEEEYKKYQQVVVFGRRKPPGVLPDEMKRLAQMDVNDMEELPKDYQGEKIRVLPSAKDSIRTFLCKEFHPEQVIGTVHESPLLSLLGEKLKFPAYGIGNLERPPIMPCNNQLYLLAMCGGGEGLAGTEENQDLHLQRGIVKPVSYSAIEKDERGKLVEIVRTTSKVSFNLIEADGTILELA